MVILLTIVQHKYGDARYQYWGGWMSGILLQNTDALRRKRRDSQAVIPSKLSDIGVS